MKDSQLHASLRKEGLYLGVLPERAAAQNPSTPITLDHDFDVFPDAGRRFTVSRLAEYVDDLAARLWAAGVRPDEYAVVHKSANSDVCLLHMAVSRIGAVPVMLSPALDGATVGALMRRLDRPTLITDTVKLDAFTGAGPGTGTGTGKGASAGDTGDSGNTGATIPDLADLTTRVLTVAGDRPGAESLADLAGSPRVAPVYRPIDEAGMITHTSGTTGLPKLVVHTPRTMGVRLTPQWRLLSLMRRRETVAIHISFVHSRMSAALALALCKQMPVLLMNNSDPEDTARFFLANRPGFIEALPNALMDWEPLAEDPRKPLASVKVFSSTFDAIHPRTMGRLLAASARRAPLFFQIYGQSEVGPAVGRPYFRGSAHKTDGRCVGWVMPGGAKVRVVTKDGSRATKSNPGAIQVSWPALAKTYLGEQKRYDENRHGAWWNTGDVGYRTRAGCLHMLDREVDMIEGVESSLEVEDQVLGALDELSELVVVSGPGGEAIPVICTHDDKPLDRARWRRAAAGFPNLSDPVQIPQAELPRTATLKVQRLELSRRLPDLQKLTG